MRKILLLPTTEQWQKWSLPSKLTLIGTLSGVIGLIITLRSMIFTSDPQIIVQKKYYSINEMRKDVAGFNTAYLKLIKDTEQVLEKIKTRNDPSNDWRYKFEVKLLKSDAGGADLNGDGLPEMYIDLPINCGTGGCTSDIYTFNKDQNTMQHIGQLPTRNFQLAGTSLEGWATIQGSWRLGACEHIDSFYTFQNGTYVEESTQEINDC